MAKRKRMKIDLATELAASWDRLWKANLESRLKGHDYGGRTYFLTASDLERDVREHLEARARDEDRRAGVTEWRTFRISGLGGTPLLGHVRDWIRGHVCAGKLEGDDRRRGHCSGMRFRPTGSPASPAEKKADAVPTAEKRRQRWIVHLTVEKRVPGSYAPLKRACAGTPKKKRASYGRPRPGPGPTDDPARVTCKKCRKILERDFVRVACFGAFCDPVLARVLEREADGSARAAVDALGNLYYVAGPGTEFLSPIPNLKKVANG